MDARRASKWPARLLGALILLLGLALLAGGGYLLMLGGSPYYLLAGAGLVLCGAVLMARRHGALALYAVVLLGTTLWAVWEVGFDGWQLAPRIALFGVIGVVLLLPWWRRGTSILSSLALAFSVMVAIGVAIASQVMAPTGIDAPVGASSLPGPLNPDQVASDDWVAYGGTNAATHYSSLDEITPDNIAQLQEVWRIRTGDTATPTSPPEITNQNTPLKVNDRLYICTSHSRVKALDPETGETEWTFDPELSTMGAEDFSHWAHMTCRGVTYYDVARVADIEPQDEVGNATDAPIDAAEAAAGHEGDPGLMISETDVMCPRRIFVPTADARLIALNADSGERCTSFGEDGEVDLTRNMGEIPPGGYYATSPAVATADLIIVGGHVTDNSSMDEPSGVVRAFDVRSGELVWNWDSGNPTETTPVGDDQAYTRNSPNVWAPMSVDERLGLVYLPMGNATPDQWGAERSENDERYSAGLVALELETGGVAWVHQFVHHDLWDMDTPAQPVLIDLAVNGRSVPAVIQPTKQGSLFVLNRQTGDAIVPIDELPAPQGAVDGDWTAATQPRSALNLVPPPLTGRDMWGGTPLDQLMCRIRFRSLRYDGQYTPPSLQGSIVYPGNVGVFNWSGIAVDPRRQAIFTTPNSLAFVSRLIPRDQVRAGEGSASEQGLQPNTGAPYAVELGPLLSPLGIPCQAPPWGEVAGIDLAAEGGPKVAWRHRNGTTRDSMPFDLPVALKLGVPALGGPTTTAGGVTFVSGTLDQYVRGYDVVTGEQLWESRLPAGGQATPMTYRGDDGRQYVVVTAGGHGTFGSTMGDYVIGYALPE